MLNAINYTTESTPLSSYSGLNTIDLEVFDQLEGFPELTEKLGVMPIMQLFSQSVHFLEYYPRSIELLMSHLNEKRVELTVQEIVICLKCLTVWHKYTAGGITRSDVQEYASLIPIRHPGSIEETFFRIAIITYTPGLSDIDQDELLGMDFNEFIYLIAIRLQKKFNSIAIEP
ncbi:MAG: hypothetical protein ACMG57_01295 [Candidatus Dojkabacteria bacterium]